MKTITEIETIINEMVIKIKKEYQPERIVLFGSYAYGVPTPDSDVDLLIIKNDPRPPIERRVEIRRIVSQENREIAITPLVYTPQEINYRLTLGDDFIAEIIKKGKVLHAE